MVNVLKLKAVFVENGKTQAEVAKGIGMSETTFNRRLSKAEFGSEEIDALVKFLNIKEPVPIFFPDWVT